jgi:hypothetical protein
MRTKLLKVHLETIDTIKSGKIELTGFYLSF